MSYSNEFKSTQGLLNVCKKYEKIVISGPHRAGTTFLTRQLAEQLNYTSIYLEDFYVHDEDVFLEILNTPGHKVIQCPTMCHLLHELKEEDVLIVFLKRELKDILASEERIHWTDQKSYLRGVHMDEEDFEKSKYLKSKIPGIKFYDSISKIKIDTWDNYQKDKIDHKLELSFSQMESLFPEAWVAKRQRKDFHPRQTQLDTDEDFLLNKNYQLFSTNSEDHFCQLFIDSGNGYSEEESIRKRIFSGLNKVVFDLQEYKNIKAIRFDPINDYGIVEIIKIESVDAEGNTTEVEIFDSNGYELMEYAEKLVFDHKDSNIFLSDRANQSSFLLIHFDLEKLETTLKYLFETLKSKKQATDKETNNVSSATDAVSTHDVLLKKINGKLNLQSGELAYIKTLISKIKPGNKEQPVYTTQSESVNTRELTKLLEKEKGIQKKLDSIESTIVDEQITIKSLLDMTGVEIKSALDKINSTFQSNEQHKLLLDKYRKMNIALDNELLILKHQIQEQQKVHKSKTSEINKLSKRFETVQNINIKLKEELRLIKKYEKQASKELKDYAKKELQQAVIIQNLKKEIEKTQSEIQQLLLLQKQEIEKNALLERDLEAKNSLIEQFEQLQEELNFLTAVIK